MYHLYMITDFLTKLLKNKLIMLWYNFKKFATSSYEKKIIISDIERIVRRKLFYKNDANASIDKIPKLVNKVLAQLETQYGNLDTIRTKIAGENLSPAIEKAVNKIIH